MDFAKAFDKVDFGVTLRKLDAMGISGRVGHWVHSFLTNRTQTVLVNKCRSRKAVVKSGVPQGSVLGPLLFLILIGDIDKDVAVAFLSSFADDTRVGNSIRSIEDTETLQNDLQSVYNWTTDNNMELHGDKFEHLHYTGKPMKDRQPPHSYTSSSGLVIEEKHTLKKTLE